MGRCSFRECDNCPMMYQSFAYLYDALMDEAPYDEWMALFKRKQSLYAPHAQTVLDLACGTGEITIRLLENGFDVTGVDLSADMLTVAQQKVSEKGYSIPLIQQDMTQLEGIGSFDAVVIFCDSLNYLKEESDFIETFSSVYDCLNDHGLFLFDVHSQYKIQNGYIGKSYSFNDDEISYIWNCFPGEFPDSVEHELTFFVYDEYTGKYDRYDEVHQERTFPVEQYKKWLEEAGFTIHSIDADFKDEPVTEKAERIFFTAQKLTK